MTIDYALLARITGRHYRLLGRAIAGSRDNASTPTPSRPRPGPIERPGGKSKSNSHGGPSYTHLPPERLGVGVLVFTAKPPGNSPVETLSSHWFGG